MCFDEIDSMLAKLMNQAKEEGDEPAQFSLQRIWQMRKEIDGIDDEIIALLLRRMEIASTLGNLKHELGLPVRDPSREEIVLQKVAQRAGNSQWRDHIVELFKAIMDESCKVQED